jgi:KDO2-lipid IV(A) lauroyltransferase
MPREAPWLREARLGTRLLVAVPRGGPLIRAARARRGGQYWLWRASAGLVGWLPPPAGLALADAAGLAAYLVAPRARRHVRANLRHVLGRRPPEALVRAVFQHGARNYYDLLRLPHLAPEALRALVTVDGWEHLHAARAAGRGVLLVTAHLGSVNLVGQLVALAGCPTSVVVEALSDPAVRELLSRWRASHGIRPIVAGPAALRAIRAALARNEVVGLFCDRDVTGTGIPVRFFDAPARLPAGAAVLGLRTGAAVLPAFAARLPDGRYRGWFEPPLALPRTGDWHADVRAATEQIARRLEAAIRRYPAQWTVFQPVWETAAGTREAIGGRL